MKTVFKSNEIAHIWANSSAPYGRSPGNLSFEGDVIKSYATVIGRRISDRGRTAYVLDRASFSNSTAKSQSRVWAAIRGDAKVFLVRCGARGQSLSFTGKGIAEHYETRAAQVLAREPSRYAFKRAEQYQEATALLEQSRDALAFFGYGTARLDKKLVARKAGEADAADALKEYGLKLRAAKLARETREKAERIARNIAEAEKFLADERPATRWLDTLEPHRASAFALLPSDLQTRVAAKVNASNSSLLTRWRSGAAVELPYDSGTLLRAEGDEMVTSKGARVPLTDAQRTYRFALLVRAKGWHRNGETHAIGGYQLDAVNETGVVAGCHRVTWEEIEQFAAAQKWEASA
jgi:hypothetical protein